MGHHTSTNATFEKDVFMFAYDYMVELVGEDALRKEFAHYRSIHPENINAVFERMLQSLQNKQGFSNYLAPVSGMQGILFHFDPARVARRYGRDFEGLFTVFKDTYTHRTFDITRKRSAWYQFTKGVISCALFLSSFKDLHEFNAFVLRFQDNEYAVAALPMLLDKEIHGLGFPLACDFLKEIGYTAYGKPDVHLKDIFFELSVVQEYSDYEVFKAIVRIASATGYAPVEVDKLFWIIGSGKLDANNMKISRQKKQFIDSAHQHFKTRSI